MQNRFYYSVGLLIGLAVLVITQMPTSVARMVVCDVGQGDGILITKGATQVLIDGGPSGQKILKCLADHIPFWDRSIELIVLTNTDYDHINGLSAVLERYSLTEFVTADGVHESAALTRFVDRLNVSGAAVVGVEQGDLIRIGASGGANTLAFKVLWPPEVEERFLSVFGGSLSEAESEQILGASAKRGDLNERSVVMLLEENNYKVLLTGDSGDQAEKGMLEGGVLEKIDLLKVGHHGSKYSTGAEFLQIVNPERAIISVGEKNRYGHPTQEVIARLTQIGAEILRTDRDGTVVIELKQ